MEGNICSVVRCHFNIFRFFCFCPISLSARSKITRIQEHLWSLWSLFIVTALSVVTYSYFTHHEIFMHTDDLFGFAVDCIKLFTTYFAMQISILEPLFKKHYEHAFWRQYMRLSSTRELGSISFWTQVKEYKSFLIKFYLYFLINLSLETIVLAVLWGEPTIKLIYWTIMFVYTYFLRFRSMHLMFCLDLVAVEIQTLDRDMQLLVEYSEFGVQRNTFPGFDEFIRLRIVEKQKIYEDIYEMVESFKNTNGLSIITNYFKYFVRVLVSCYWLYWTFHHSFFTIKDIMLISAVLEIPMFLLTAKSCMTAAKYISYRVHNLKHSSDNVATSIQIQNFSLQLLHQQIKIDGLGIASMDGYMLTRAIGSIITYMVFFIQFMPKFKSKFE